MPEEAAYPKKFRKTTAQVMPTEHLKDKKINNLKDKWLQVKEVRERHGKRYRASWWAVANLSKDKTFFLLINFKNPHLFLPNTQEQKMTLGISWLHQKGLITQLSLRCCSRGTGKAAKKWQHEIKSWELFTLNCLPSVVTPNLLLQQSRVKNCPGKKPLPLFSKD